MQRLEAVAMQLEIPVVCGVLVYDSHTVFKRKASDEDYGAEMAALTVELGMLQDNIETSKCPIPAN